MGESSRKRLGWLFGADAFGIEKDTGDGKTYYAALSNVSAALTAALISKMS